jgi:2-(3-amino-3-carboxypropyl)histidine synthase
MDKTSYDLELGRVRDEIKKRNARVIGLQFPDGLKMYANEVATEISEESGVEVEVIISGNSCYGACDVDEKLEQMVDVLFHWGHSETPLFHQYRYKYNKKCVFIELRSNVDVKPVVEKALEEIEGEKVGLVTTVQHVHALDEVKILLSGRGKQAVIKKISEVNTAMNPIKIKYDGQVLGCDFYCAMIPSEEILFVGGGSFHPSGLALYTGKKIIAADPFTSQINIFKGEQMRKKRYVVIERSLEAKSFGVIIGQKSGQCNLNVAKSVYRKARERGFAACLITMTEIKEEKMMQFSMGVDAFINTACPRIVEDFVYFRTPVLTVAEFEVVIGDRRWEDIFTPVLQPSDTLH